MYLPSIGVPAGNIVARLISAGSNAHGSPGVARSGGDRGRSARVMRGPSSILPRHRQPSRWLGPGGLRGPTRTLIRCRGFRRQSICASASREMKWRAQARNLLSRQPERRLRDSRRLSARIAINLCVVSFYDGRGNGSDGIGVDTGRRINAPCKPSPLFFRSSPSLAWRR